MNRPAPSTAADWLAWVVALHRPQRLDDEAVPDGVDLPPWWNRKSDLESAFGARAERKPSAGVTLQQLRNESR